MKLEFGLILFEVKVENNIFIFESTLYKEAIRFTY